MEDRMTAAEHRPERGCGVTERRDPVLPLHTARRRRSSRRRGGVRRWCPGIAVVVPADRLAASPPKGLDRISLAHPALGRLAHDLSFLHRQATDGAALIARQCRTQRIAHCVTRAVPCRAALHLPAALGGALSPAGRGGPPKWRSWCSTAASARTTGPATPRA